MMLLKATIQSGRMFLEFDNIIFMYACRSLPFSATARWRLVPTVDDGVENELPFWV